MSEKNKSDYLAFYGRSLIDNGYNIIPIVPGKKSPMDDGWSKIKSTPKVLAEWVSGGQAAFGVGIQTKHTPAIDLDITDTDVVKAMRDFIESEIGFAPIRVGRAPRQLLLFRCDEPFRKMKTGKYEDEWGDKHEVEILADGQQFVAYGMHPDIQKEFEWITKDQPTNIHIDDLPVLTAEDCKRVLDKFRELATAAGWKKVTTGLSGGVRAPNIDDDDPFADVESVVDISNDELRERLMLMQNADDYDTWIQVGMALHHQFGGGEEGLKMWHEWSEVADNYDHDALEKHWKSLEIAGKKRAPITARFILKKSKDDSLDAAINLVNDLRDELRAATDIKVWREVCNKVKRAEIDSISRAQIAEVAKKMHQAITGEKVSIVEIRRAVAYEMPANVKTPEWCKNWVFDAATDRFFHLTTKITMSVQGFNAVYSRKAMTQKDIAEGRSNPSSTPADLALNLYQVREIYGTEYAPTQETLFNKNGLRVGNTYPDYQVPKTPDELTPKDKRAIRIVKAHAAHLIEDEEEQALFIDWLAYIVQNPGKLVGWAMVLQGVEGDGKSFWGFLLRAVMGVSNVRMLNAAVLEGAFNGWSHGQCVIVVEEPRLQGHNKYEVINKVKPLITNSVIEVHAKGRDPYNVDNTTNYYLPTNFRDALPLNENDRRYCILFSRWQNRDALRQFKLENPDYYLELYRAIQECAPALRKWLVEHKISDDFPAGGDAPITKAHGYMVNAAKPEPIKVLDEIIKEGQYPDITEDLVNASALPDAMIGRDTELPQTQGLTRLLEHNGYVFLDKIRIDGKYGRYWSKKPELFKEGSGVSFTKVRSYIAKRIKKLQEDEL